jgi:nucleoside phosphorylase
LSASESTAVICAMDFELAHLERLLAGSGWPVEVVLSGPGMDPAASATREILARRRPRAVLNYGCAGAHRADLGIGDIVVGTRAVAYSEGEGRFIECDPELVDIAREVATGFERVTFGTVASADAWNRTPESIEALAALHQSLCEDMEAAAIGLVCAAEGVPFLTIKDISNNELIQPTLGWQALLRELGVDQVARRAAEFTFSVIGKVLGQTPASRAAPGPVRPLQP